MIKMVTFNRAKDGVSAEEYRTHYENVHVPLIRSLFPTLGPFRRNYVDRGRTALTERNAREAAADTGFDSITEAFFADWGAFEAFRDRSAAPEVRARITADEELFLDPSAIRRFIVAPEGDSPWS